MTPQQALDKIRSEFPFKGYFLGDQGPWLTVGELVEKYTVPGAELFDFGSGACDKTAIAAAFGCKCTATDNLQDDWYRRGDNVNQIKAFAGAFGIDFTESFQAPAEGRFDKVMMNDVLEHIHDSPREILNSLVSGLKTGGLLFITVPNLANARKRLDLLRGRTNLAPYDMYYWYKGPWRGPQREYVRGDMVSLAHNLGLEVELLETRHHMLHNLPAMLRPLYKGATAVLRDWRDTWVLIARKPEGWQPRLDISDQEFARIYGKTSNSALYGSEV